ncbi:MAG: hypothetical protein N3G22_01030 [Candidatus Micrarchaeota archaeon]|nr:hypothetical protein [Candidatus Micrarchaeota archaeon]
MEEEEADEEAQQQLQAKLQKLQIEMKKKELLRKMLSNEAYERMMNVRLSNPELYEKVVHSLAYIAQSGRSMGQISDEQLYSLLARMSQRKETSIEFRRK